MKEQIKIPEFYYLIEKFTISLKWNSIWSIDGILNGATTPGQSRPGNNHSEEALHILKSSRTGASSSDAV